MKALWISLGILLAAVFVLFFVTVPVHSQVASTTITWTSPGDDGNAGTATKYDLRYSATRPDTTTAAGKDAWWAAASVIAGLPAPITAGSPQTTTVTPAGGFVTGTTYYFVIRTKDEAGNWSDWSNVAWRLWADTTPPARIIDLVVH